MTHGTVCDFCDVGNINSTVAHIESVLHITSLAFPLMKIARIGVDSPESRCGFGQPVHACIHYPWIILAIRRFMTQIRYYHESVIVKGR